MKIVKIVFGFVIQYVKLVIATFFSVCAWRDVGNIFVSIICALLLWGIVYGLCSMVYIVLNCFRKPKECKILHLSKNTIHMKPKYYKDKKQFVYDFDTILQYAQDREYTYIDTKTHIRMVSGLLEKYVTKDFKSVIRKCMKIENKENIEIDTDIGKIIIKRIADGVNYCAKYEYGRIMTAKQFIKTLKIIKRYDIRIELKNK